MGGPPDRRPRSRQYQLAPLPRGGCGRREAGRRRLFPAGELAGAAHHAGSGEMRADGRTGGPAVRRSGGLAVRRSGAPAVRRSGAPAVGCCLGRRSLLLLALGSISLSALPPFRLSAQVYPQTPPPPGPLTPAPFPPFQEAVLGNGLRLLVVGSPKNPIGSLSLFFPAGSGAPHAGKEGLADVVAGLLTKGAGARTA